MSSPSRRRSDEPALRAEATFRGLVEALEERHILYTHSRDGVFTYLSPSITRILGYSPEEFMTHYTTYLTDHPVNREVVHRTEAATRGERQPPYEVEIFHRDGSRRWLEVSESPLFDESGAVAGVQGIAHDVTGRKVAAEALRRSEERYRSLLTQSHEGICIFDPETRTVLEMNPSLCRMLGTREGEGVGRPLEEVLRTDRDESPLVRDQAGQEGARCRTLLRKDGSRIAAEIRIEGISLSEDVLGLVSVVDVSERRNSERLQSALYRIAECSVATEDLSELYRALHDIVGELMVARNFFVALYDRDSETLTFPHFVDEKDSEPPRTRVGRGLSAYVLRSGKPLLATPERFCALVEAGEIELVGSPPVDWLGVPLKSGGRSIGVLAVQSYEAGLRYTDEDRDVLTFVSRHIAAAIDRKRASDRIRHQAYHDFLTGLPNRLLFQDRLSQAITHARRRRDRLAVLFLDLDRFKTINDTLGHGSGDQLLRRVSDRLRLCLREGDTVARLGGDEFLILLEGLRSEDDPHHVAAKILASLRPSFQIGSHELHLTASIGIALYPQDGATEEALIQHADIALYQAKEGGRDAFSQFRPEMGSQALELLSMENRLRRALEKGELTLHYQPLVRLQTGRIVGAEALLRWRDEAGGLVMPDEFVPLAEETGMIVPIGEWVLHAACSERQRWSRLGVPEFPISVNLSARQFHQPDLDRLVAEVLAETGLPSHLLEIELTESVLSRTPELTVQLLQELRERGVRISIDDFGTGYSSLSNLRRFPIHGLKIDRSFVRDCTTDPDDAAIVQAVISLGQSLRLRVIAEGVETPEQLALLRRWRCDDAQGFLFGRPASAEETRRRLTREKRSGDGTGSRLGSP